MGAWIEINAFFDLGVEKVSHPTWVRGLKYETRTYTEIVRVAPHVGAWIEIAEDTILYLIANVAPHVGAWIEISKDCLCGFDLLSHPTWVRGLKYPSTVKKVIKRSRTPRGCVD